MDSLRGLLDTCNTECPGWLVLCRGKGMNEVTGEGVIRWYGDTEGMESDRIAEGVYGEECLRGCPSSRQRES